MASIDLIEEVRKQIGYKPIPKIDPNTQASKPGERQLPDLGNAVIPALLVGFYKHTRNEIQATELINEDNPDRTLDILFGDQKNNIIQSVSGYACIPEEKAETEMKNTASIIKKVVQKEVKQTNGKTISAFFSDQRSNILKHLPVELNMGELMHDPAIDDRTNKMEGPMSGFMHTIEKIFSSAK